jgi:alpha-L-rhamnosidase
MLREGATTCFEAWGKDQKWNTSLCHPWASSPIPVIIEDIVGLKPAKPGWEEICFAPRIPECLGNLSLKLQTPKGEVTVFYNEGRIDLQVPDGVIVYRT